MTQQPHWHLLGAGAIGCLYAGHLRSSGCDISLIMRKGKQPASLPIITEHGGIRSEQHVPVVTPNSHAPISHLVITTKAYDVSEAVASIAHLLSEDSVVVLLVNGMGLAEQLAADWPHLNIFCGTTTEGAYCLAPQHIQHTGRGKTRIGKQGEKKPPPWFEKWSDAIDTCVWDSDIEAALWSKMAINCIINPLTALHNCANGELSQRPELITQVTTLCGEVSKITRAAGFTAIAAALPQLVAGVIAATANNRSSMLKDVENGRRTEIDYITGFLLRVADQHGIDAPHNRALLKSIKSHER